MGFRTSAYHFYGLPVPDAQWVEQWAGAEGERVEVAIRALRKTAPDVSYLTAGDYDRDRLFLCIHQDGVSVEVALGTFRMVGRSQVADHHWDAQLAAVATAMGYKDLGRPGWITVPDVS